MFTTSRLRKKHATCAIFSCCGDSTTFNIARDCDASVKEGTDIIASNSASKKEGTNFERDSLQTSKNDTKKKKFEKSITKKILHENINLKKTIKELKNKIKEIQKYQNNVNQLICERDKLLNEKVHNDILYEMQSELIHKQTITIENLRLENRKLNEKQQRLLQRNFDQWAMHLDFGSSNGKQLEIMESIIVEDDANISSALHDQNQEKACDETKIKWSNDSWMLNC